VSTAHTPLPPAKISRGSGGEPAFVDAAIMCQGSIISGGHVERSIIGTQAYIDHDAHVTDAIVFPGVRIGAGARVRHCIIDKNVVVPPGFRVGFDEQHDRLRFTVSDRGVVAIEKDRNLLAD
jgi:glucose-1-phosphate adenylyltransferase